MLLGVFLAVPSFDPAPAVTMRSDSRKTVDGAYPATGQLNCPGGVGTGHLVGSNNTILTAAHVVIGSDSSACIFTLRGSGKERSFRVDLSRMRVGSSNPRNESAARDWAVVRLASPAIGVRPYKTGAPPQVGTSVILVSGRTIAAGGVTTETCRTKAPLPGPEIAIDCSAQSGDSGAALVSPSGQLTGIYVGFRSTAPSTAAAFSSAHYNFALPVSPAIRSAIAELAR
jgi:uncharacterized protein (DUF736 family)